MRCESGAETQQIQSFPDLEMEKNSKFLRIYWATINKASYREIKLFLVFSNLAFIVGQPQFVSGSFIHSTIHSLISELIIVFFCKAWHFVSKSGSQICRTVLHHLCLVWQRNWAPEENQLSIHQIILIITSNAIRSVGAWITGCNFWLNMKIDNNLRVCKISLPIIR